MNTQPPLESPFEPLPSSVRKSEYVMQQILDSLQEGVFPVGSRLPSERDIAGHMNVSRTVVREAIRAFELAGILESRVGDGTYVMAVPSGERTEPSDSLVGRRLSASFDVMEALQARRALDLAVLRLLEYSTGSLDTSQLRSMVEEMHSCVDEGALSQYLTLSLEIHTAIAELTENQVLVETVRFASDIVRERLWIIERSYNPSTLSVSLSIHTELVRALDEADFETAIRLVQRHYDEYPFSAEESPELRTLEKTRGAGFSRTEDQTDG